jgi:hypothetical protein
VKNFVARTTLISLLLGIGAVTQGRAEDYYIYQTSKGELVISNKQPPPSSKIIRQLPGETDREFHKPKHPVSCNQTYRQKAHRSRSRPSRSTTPRRKSNPNLHFEELPI